MAMLCYHDSLTSLPGSLPSGLCVYAHAALGFKKKKKKKTVFFFYFFFFFFFLVQIRLEDNHGYLQNLNSVK